MMLRNIVVLFISVLLMVGPVDLSAQQKKNTTTNKTTTTSKKPATTSKKPATTSKKPATTNKKPATTQKNSTQKSSTQKSSTQKPAAKQSSSKQESSKPAEPAKKLSRAEYEKQQRDLQKQIAATEKMISENDQSVLAQNRDIQLRKDEIGKRQALMRAMQHEIDAIRDEEDSLQQVIVRLSGDYAVRQEKFTQAVHHLFKWRSGYDAWMFVLSAEDALSSLRRLRYLSQYSTWRKHEAHELERERLATQSVKQKLELTRADRETLRGSLERERQNLSAKQRLQEEAVNNLKKRNKELKGELATAQKKQREIQKMIQQLIEEERRKAEEARKKAEAGNKKGDTSGKNEKKEQGLTYYSPAEVAQLTGSFRQNKGKMPYPVDSNYAFLSHYTADGNYSINLSTAVGAHACAIFEGTVIRVARSSEDYTIIISHGEYMSVYSNLSAAHVKEGDRVKMRQSVGVVKADIDNRRAELMFWIYGKNDAENPEAWLKK